MDTMKVIYKILNALEESLDKEDFEPTLVGHEAIGISQYKWNRIIHILQSEGFVDGFKEYKAIGMKFPCYVLNSPTITFKGLVYLSENSNTAKIVNAAKLLKDVIPGI